MTNRPAERVTVWDIPKLLSPEALAYAREQAAKMPPFTPEQRELLRSTMHIVFPEDEH